MKYIFGSVERNGAPFENLKTIGEKHSCLSPGTFQIVQEQQDQTTTDCCNIVRKYHSAEDAEGNCYDWYEIDSHYSYVDSTKPLKEQAADTDAMAIDHEMRITMLELGV